GGQPVRVGQATAPAPSTPAPSTTGASSAPPPAQAAAPAGVGGGPIVIDSAGARPAGASTVARALSAYDGSGVSVSSKVGEIFFAQGSSALDGNDRRVVREIAAYQRQYGGRVRVVGHASPGVTENTGQGAGVGSLRLSAQRADAVAQALGAAGVPSDRIFAGAVTDTPGANANAAFTRRVEVFLDY
ncbi:OmpA family protein, partial [Pararhodospirillum oryzae]|uniref:OmpA family protein n=1 Tax=Pararhodospirillum oryzae TaxID=478448 RepID=UPI0011BE44CA